MKSLLAQSVDGDSPVHRADARVKIVLLFAYTMALFAVARWGGMAASAVAFCVVVALARLPFDRMLSSLAPLCVVLVLTLLFGGLTASEGGVAVWTGAFALQDGILAETSSIPVAGALRFAPAGFESALFNVVRIALLALASMVVALTTPVESLMDALRSLLSPLRRVRVPVDDAATALALAVRFVPVLGEELSRVRDAQRSRGAQFDSGGLPVRLRAWGRVLVPLFVGVFRRADRLATAMDARCYGASPTRTSLGRRKLEARDTALLVLGLAVCAACALLGRGML